MSASNNCSLQNMQQIIYLQFSEMNIAAQLKICDYEKYEILHNNAKKCDKQ